MEIRCPACNRFLGEGSGFIRVICPKCRVEVTASRKGVDKRELIT